MTLARPREIGRAAERAFALVEAHPARAHALAEQAVALARGSGDAYALAVALHALGYAKYALGDQQAVATMRAAVRTAERHGLHERAIISRRNLALYLAYRGQLRLALAEIDAVHAAQQGIERARTEVFRLAVYSLAGRLGAVLPDVATALATLRRRGDKAWEARLAFNRGSALAELGEHRTARRDLERARALYSELGLGAAVTDARRELASLAAVEGDPLRCLSELDAIDLGSVTDWTACWLHLPRAEALLALRLLPEARADLARFAELSTRVRAADSLNKARLDAARLSLAAGDTESAATLAAAAARSFRAHGQPAFAAAATIVQLSASVAKGTVPQPLARAAERAVRTLAAEGWAMHALRAHALLARTGSQAHLELARPLARRGTIADRIELCHAQALASLRSGNPARAERQLRRGLDLLEEHRSALGAAEIRASASSLGVDLARTGLRMAVESGSPRRVLAWSERLRSNALRLPAVRPPADPAVRAAQSELRVLARRDPSTRVATRRNELEAVVRERTRLARGTETTQRAESLSRASAVLATRALVEYVELDGRLLALTLAGGRLGLHELDPSGVDDELSWLRFALGRLARGRLSAAQRAAAEANANAGAAMLERALVAPLLPAVGDAPLVLVPTGLLHVVPWSALPALRGRSIVVAPSLTQWLGLRQRARRGRTVLVAGPRLRHAAAEVRDVAELLPAATVLRGREATVEATLDALDGASLAHVACHGRFRDDSPLFSSLELADGPLTALDLQGLRRAPDTLVLSACDVALSERHAGDELLGLSATLLAIGTRTIVASVVPVSDRAARRVLLEFHRGLLAGASPAAALARAQAGSKVPGFICLGDG
jgi:hypothetical protein